MKDRKVVNAFIAYLRENGHPDLQPDRYPEDENSGDIDAVAGKFAIEHTSIDTLPNQRRDSDWFMQAVGGLEKEIRGKLPFRLNIFIDYDAIIKGQEWSSIRGSLRAWIINNSSRLSDGRHTLENIPGVPFRLYVTKASDRPPGVFFARWRVPEDDSLPERICRQFESKIKKLAKYKELGATTILLVESEDIALMNEAIMLNAIQQAYPTGFPDGFDELWFVDTSIPFEINFFNFTLEIG